jgi:flagellar motor protein MotB
MADDHDKHEGGEHAEGEHKSHGHSSHGPGHGGGHEEHAGAPEWLISFADNVALLMGFFVILLAMNMGPKGASGASNGATDGAAGSNDASMMDFVVGMRNAFNNPPDPKSPDPRERELAKWAADRDPESKNTTRSPKGNKNQAQAISQGHKIDITAVVEFDLNSHEVSERGRAALASAVNKLRGSKWIVEVRGHASAREKIVEGQRDDEQGYILSYSRAMAVAIALREAGLPWNQIRVVACSDNERATPLASGTAGHRSNQRVELVVTGDPAPDDPHLHDPGH